MNPRANDNDMTLDDEQLLREFDRVVSIVHCDGAENAVKREFEKRRPDDPLEFLCLSIEPLAGRCNQPEDQSLPDRLSEPPFPDCEAVLCWVKEYRHLERDQIAAHVVSANPGSLFPIGIAVVADPLPENEAELWRAESHRREVLAEQGVMIVDRSHCSGDPTSDRQLLVDALHHVLATSAAQTQTVQSLPGPPGFDWTVNKPGGHGDLYGNQPAHVEPHPRADQDKFNEDVTKQFETYSNAFPQDLDY